MERSSSQREILYIGLNQDHSCICFGTNQGFEVHTIEPFKLKYERIFRGGIGIIEVLFRSNIVVLVGGGKKPEYPPNKVIFWDDNQSKCFAELAFNSNVTGIKIKRDKIIISIQSKVYVYNFADLKLINYVETTNAKGTIACSYDPIHELLACPSSIPGQVILTYNDFINIYLINAHQHQISFLAFNWDGTRLATASEQGTIIRIWDTHTYQQVIELRRGKDSAEINCISFSKDGNLLCVSSNTGTIHVFNLTPSVPEQSSYFTNLAGYIPFSVGEYMTSNCSFTKINLPPLTKYLCTFIEGQQNIIVIGQDRSYNVHSY